MSYLVLQTAQLADARSRDAWVDVLAAEASGGRY